MRDMQMLYKDCFPKGHLMTAYTTELDILKILIDDEHHYRTMVQSRISYHTSIILALIAAAGALTLRAESLLSFFAIGLLGWLINYISHQAVGSVERLYDHFIGAIRAREEIEIQLKIRNSYIPRRKSTVKSRMLTPKSSESSYWPYEEELLSGSWVPSDEGGFFKKTQRTFQVFRGIGGAIVVIMSIICIHIYRAGGRIV